jgi:hypothetical protein
MVYDVAEMPINERAGNRGPGRAAHDEPRSDEIEPEVSAVRPVISVAIDDIALAALRVRAERELSCSLCDAELAEGAASSGLFMWTRGDHVRFEEPPLCARCSGDVSVSAFLSWPWDDDFDE